MKDRRIKGTFVVRVDYDCEDKIEDIIENVEYIMEKYTEGETWGMSCVYDLFELKEESK